MRHYFLFLFFLAALASCGDSRTATESEIRSLMKDWYKKPIRFPSNMTVLRDSSAGQPDPAGSGPKKYRIVHFFTADCDKCVNELSMIKNFLGSMEKIPQMDVMFIASAPADVYVLDAIKKIRFPYPVLHEKEYYSFKSMNRLPLSDGLYNTMLLNDRNEVLLFGAFYDNRKAERLYKKAMEYGL